MSSLEVTFVTPASTVWSGQATQVVVPADDGSLGILPSMQPILTILGEGDVRVIGASGSVDVFRIEGGFCSVDDDNVTIGVDRLESDGASQR